MPGPGTGGPFYAALVDKTDAIFGASFYRWDLDIFRFSLKQEEGGAALLEAEVKNPWIDAPSFKFIAPGQHYWLWFAWWDGATVRPLFFGRLVGHPENIDDFFVTLQFIGQSDDWRVRRLVAAEQLKAAPYFDPAFIDPAQRNDPTAAIAARAAEWHIDRVTHQVTISHVLTGEDGTLALGEDDVLWGVRPRLVQPPIDAVTLNAEAIWSQIDSGGSVFVGAWSVETYSGKSLLSDWPKAGASLGGGWFVQAAWALDYHDIDSGATRTVSGSFTDQSPRHADGDAISASGSATMPATAAPGISFIISEEGKSAIIGEDYADPSANWSGTMGLIPRYRVDCGLYLQYEAQRQRRERLSFTLVADLQPVRSDPGAPSEVETMSLPSVDLSAPMWSPKPRGLLSGQTVARGQVIEPTNPPVGGSRAYQICITPGPLAMSEPAYGHEPDDVTTDGGAVFSWLGESLPEIGEWQPSTAVSRGTVIAPVPQIWIWRSALFPAARYRTSGGSVQKGQVIRDDVTQSFQYCVTSGEISYWGWPSFSPVYGGITTDGGAIFISLGMQISGGSFLICTGAGTTGADVRPPFPSTAGESVTDNGVVWVSLGGGGPSLSIPAGGVPGRVTARSWFPTPRGLQSVEYLINMASAALIRGARCVETQFVSPFHVAPLISLRKNATVPSLTAPGHSITGKIIEYEMTGDGDSGEFLCRVTLGSAIGNGGAESAVAGAGVYAQAGVFADGLQAVAGGVDVIDSAVGYTRPVDAPEDDGLSFPLTPSQVIAAAEWRGSLAAQEYALRAAIPYIVAQANPKAPLNMNTLDIIGVDDDRAKAARGPGTVDAVLQQAGMSIHFALALKPVTDQSFTKSYRIGVTPLRIPKMIDIAA